MIKIKRIILLMMLVFFAGECCLFAATVKLKSGRVVQGPVVEKTSEYIKIDYFGVPLTYYLDEVESITDLESQGDQPPDTLPVIEETTPVIDTKGILYVDELFGFKVTVPPWFELLRTSRQVQFSKEKEIRKEVFSPQFLISVERTSNFPSVSSALDYARGVIGDITAKSEGQVEIISYPRDISSASVDAAVFSYRLLGEDAIGNRGLSVTQYLYYMGDNIVLLMFLDGDMAFDSNFYQVKSYLESFEFLPLTDIVGYLEDASSKNIDFEPFDMQKYNDLKYVVLNTMKQKKAYKSRLVIKDMFEQGLADFGYKAMELVMTFSGESSFEFESNNFYSGGVRDVWRVIGDDMYVKLDTWIPMAVIAARMEAGNDDVIANMINSRKQAYKDLYCLRYLEFIDNYLPRDFSKTIAGFLVLRFTPDTADFLPLIDPRTSISSCEVLIWISLQDYTIRLVKATVKGSDNTGRDFLKEYQHYFTNFNLPFSLGIPLNTYN